MYIHNIHIYNIYINIKYIHVYVYVKCRYKTNSYLRNTRAVERTIYTPLTEYFIFIDIVI